MGESPRRPTAPSPRAFSCLIPAFDGALFSIEWKEALWARFFTAAPQRQRRSVEQYKIVKRVNRHPIGDWVR
jgi:hypothetical protein